MPMDQWLEQTKDVQTGADTGLDRWLAGGDDSAKLDLSVKFGRDEDPDRAARIFTMQGKTGLPKELIARNLDDIEQAAKAKDFDAAKFRQESPMLASWLAEQPEHVALAYQDLSQLSYLERQLKHIGQQNKRYRQLDELSRLGERAMLNRITPEERQRAQALQEKLSQELDYGIDGFIEGIPGAIAGQIPLMERTVLGGARGAAAGMAGGAATGATGALIAGQIGPQVATPEELVTVPAAAAAGAVAGGTAGWRIGAGIEAGRMEASLAYLEYEGLKSEDGTPLSRDAALGAATVVGVLNGALEVAGLESIVKTAPVLRGFTRKGMAALLRRPTVRRAFSRYLEGIGEAMATEGATEFLQEMTTHVAGEITLLVQSGDIQGMSSQQVLDRLFGGDIIAQAGEAAVMGMQAGGGISAVISSPGVAADVRQARRAQRNVEIFEAIGDNVQGADISKRMPEKLRELVGKITAEGGDTMYLDRGRWDSYWQSQNVDPRAVAAEVMGSPEAYDQAMTAGHDIAIPTADYAAKLAGTEHHAGFVRELRFDPLDMSAREADEYLASLEEQAADTRQEGEGQPESSAAQVRQDVLGQLLGTGMEQGTAEAQADLYESIFRTIGERTGRDPAELYRSYGLTASRPLPEILTNITRVDGIDAILDRLRAGEIPSERDVFGQSLLEFIDSKGGLLDEGGELSARDVDGGRRPFQRSIIRPDGRSLDDMAEAAVQAGYLSERDPDLLLESIDRELAGDPVYASANEDSRAADMRQMLTELQSFLDESGVNLDEADNAALKQLLERGTMPEGGTALDQSQQIAETPEFERWFGDSKVVDADGKPLVVYHGTGTEIAAFDPSLTGQGNDQYGSGFYFTTSMEQAKHYETATLPGSDQPKLGGSAKPNTVAAYLAIANPIRMSPDQETFRDVEVTPDQSASIIAKAPDILDADRSPLVDWVDNNGRPFTQRHIREVAQSYDNLLTLENDFFRGAATAFREAVHEVTGFDGVEKTFSDGSKHYVAWFPEQIKSVNNRGTFDPDDPRILYQETVRRTYVDGDIAFEGPGRGPEQLAISMVAQNGSVEAARRVVDGLEEQGTNAAAIEAMRQQLTNLEGKTVEQRDEAAGGAEASAFVPPSDRLSALHNLSYDNLLFADKQGGLAVPSIAVVRDGMGAEGYGEITLIGRKEMADPASERVFDADAYTTTFPPPDYKAPKVSDARALTSDLFSLAARFDDNDDNSFFVDLYERADPRRAVERALYSPAVKAKYIEGELGQEIEPVMRPAPTVVGDWVLDPEFSARYREVYDRSRSQSARDYRQSGEYAALSEAARQTITRYVDAKALREGTRTMLLDAYSHDLFDEQGLLKLAKFDQIARDVYRESETEVDVRETRDRVDAALRGHEIAFKTWLERQVLGIFGEPRLKLGRKFVPYTLDNIVEWMGRQRARASEETLVHGPGKVRAAASVRFSSLEQMRRASDQIKPPADVEAARNAAEAKLSDWREAVLKHFTVTDWRGNIDTWEGLNASMRALARWARSKDRSKATLKRALAAEDFKSVPAAVVEQGIEAGRALMEAPVPYFEAKPKRVVQLEEFAGAVIPADAPAEVTAVLDRRGIPHRTYPDRHDEAARAMVVDEFRRDLAEGGEEVLFQRRGGYTPDQGTVRRGSIRFGADRQFRIELYKDADLSTFLHESGHFFLEVLGDLAQAENAPQQIRDDYRAALDWLGVSSREDIATEHHEKWARGFEAYLFEGKAPSAGMRSAFARFRSWLIAVYRRISALDVELSDEVRGVFDRLVATDAEIEAAQADAAMQPMFDSADAAQMDAEAWDAYLASVQAARIEAEEDLTRRAMAEVTRETKAWWKSARAAVREEVEAEVNGQRDYVAASVLGRGKLPDGQPLPDGMAPFKLSKAALVKDYGEAFLSRLPRPYVYARNGGLPPDVAAEILGFENGEALVMALAELRPRAALIEAETDARMRERYGDIRTDGTLPAAAMAAVHNDARADLLLKEVSALARRTRRRVAPIALVREQADRTIGRTKIRSLRPDLYLRAERKASREAFEAAARQDFEAAFAAKQRQQFNHELYRAATAAKDRAEQTRRYFATFSTKATRQRLAKAGEGYLDQIDALLERFEFRRVSLRALDRRQALARFISEQEASGMPVEIPDKLANEAFRTNYRELSVEELSGLRDAVKNLAHLAWVKNKLLAAKAERDMDAAVDAIVSGTARFHDVTPLEPDPTAKSALERTNGTISAAAAAHTKLEFLFEYLDGNKAQGPVWEHLFRPLAEAEIAEQRMMREVSDNVSRVFSVYGRRELSRGFFRRDKIDGVATAAGPLYLTKAQQLVVALNWGNTYNREALMEGWGWSEADVQRILSRLNARDWEVVQSIWDYIDSFWPEIARLERDLTGLAPEKVQAAPVETPFGTFRGGYYPILFDAHQSWRQSVLDEKANVQELFGSTWARAMTRHGHTKERTNTGGKPIRLELSGLSQHLTNVVHDLAFRRALIDVDRLAKRTEVRQAIEAAAGREYYKQINPWLHAIASDRRQLSNPVEALLGHARAGATVVNMGYKATTALFQPLGYTVSAKELGYRYAIKGLRIVYGPNAYKSFRESWEFVTSRSTMMDERMRTFDRDVRDTMKRLNLEPGSRMHALRQSFFQHIALLDISVALPTWQGAYAKAMDGAADGVPAGDEAAAIAYADRTVRITQSSGAAKDLAGVQQGSEAWRLFTMFYSYFSVLFNQFQKTGWQYGLTRNLPEMFNALMLLWFVPVVLEDLMRGLYSDEEPEDRISRLVFNTATYPFQGIVIVRDIVNGMGEYGYDGSAALDAFGSLSRAGQIAGEQGRDLIAGEDENELTRADVKALTMATGYALKLPARQAWISAEYFHDWMTGEEQPESVMEGLWRGLVAGKPRE